MKFTKEQIVSISNKLRSMPKVEPKRDFNKQEAVKLLIKDIQSLQKRGYTLDQISQTLRGEGLDISTPTLKNCIQRARPINKPVEKASQKPLAKQAALQ